MALHTTPDLATFCPQPCYIFVTIRAMNLSRLLTHKKPDEHSKATSQSAQMIYILFMSFVPIQSEPLHMKLPNHTRTHKQTCRLSNSCILR